MKGMVFILLLIVFIGGCSNKNKCGNELCEYEGDYKEEYGTCSVDCINCDDENICTEDSFDYSLQKCRNLEISPCCGNDICEPGETRENCIEDCNYELEVIEKKIYVTDIGDYEGEYGTIGKATKYILPYEEGKDYYFNAEDFFKEYGKKPQTTKFIFTIRNKGQLSIEDIKIRESCSVRSDGGCQIFRKEQKIYNYPRVIESIELKAGKSVLYTKDTVSLLPPSETVRIEYSFDTLREKFVGEHPRDEEYRIDYCNEILNPWYIEDSEELGLSLLIQCDIEVYSEKTPTKVNINLDNYYITQVDLYSGEDSVVVG